MTQVMRSSSHRRLRGTWLLEHGFRKVVYVLFMVGMVATIGFAILRTGGPVSFLQQVFTVLTGGGGSAPMRNAFAPVSGLTSLTQLGVLIVLIEAINVKWVDHAPDRRTSRRRLWWSSSTGSSGPCSPPSASPPPSCCCRSWWCGPGPTRSARPRQAC